MVKVFRCHHFTGQDVLGSEHEPMAMCCSDEHVFVATAQCHIEVFNLLEKGSPRIKRIPTIGHVIDILYNKADAYIATLEETHHKVIVRVYLNWTADLAAQPMRARVAGNMAGSRLDDDGIERLEVVEIPLKEEPSCLGTCNETGNLAVAIDKQLIVYGLCCKVLACCKKVYEDIKAILELKFSFRIKHVALCEEFVVCAGKREFQIIRCNVDYPFTPYKKLMDSEDSAGDITRISELNKELGVNVIGNNSGTRTDILLDPSIISISSGKSSADTQVSTSEVLSAGNYVVDDEHCVELDFNESKPFVPKKTSENAETAASSAVPRPRGMVRQASSMDGAHAPVQRTPSPVMDQTGLIWLDSIKKANKSAMADSKSSFTEIVGPVDSFHKACPVGVEYEDSCGCSDNPSNVLEDGVTTLMFKKFNYSTLPMVSAQFQPVYFSKDCDTTSEDEANQTYDNFGSHKRPFLIGVYCFVSSSMEGYVYDVLGKVKLLAKYPYTSNAYEMSLADNQLVVLSETGLEIYTTHTICAAMHAREMYDGTTEALPPADTEVCLIGIQPFIGAEYLAVSTSSVAIMTKTLDDTNNSNDSWNVYVLQRPSWQELYKEMTELSISYKQTSVPPYVHMILEAHILLRSQLYLASGCSEDEHQRKKSCLQLGLYYASGPNLHDTKWSQPYFEMTGYTMEKIISKFNKVIRDTAGQNEEGILYYLDHSLFHSENDICLSKEAGNMVLDVYLKNRPSMLSSLIVKSNLCRYSSEHALGVLQKWMKSHERQQSASKKIDLMALALVHLELGNIGEAESLVFSLSKNDLTKLCLENHHILHNNLQSLTAISQLLRKNNPDVFLEILVNLNDTVVTKDVALSLLRGSKETSGHQHERRYLELLLNDGKRHYIFEEASALLITYYLHGLQTQEKPDYSKAILLSYKEIVPHGTGHFARRYKWLDALPPFNGCAPSQSPCNRVMLNKSWRATSASVLIHPEGGASEKTESCDTCKCCMCNDTLLKLQSLLCSRRASTDICRTTLGEISRWDPATRTTDSLKVLCLSKIDPRAATDFVIESYPNLVAEIVEETFGDNQEIWAYVTDQLFNIMRTKEVNADRENSSNWDLKDSLSGVLRKLALLMSPTDFMNLLPSDGSMRYFIGHMEVCVKAHEAKNLKNSIMNQAKEME